MQRLRDEAHSRTRPPSLDAVRLLLTLACLAAIVACDRGQPAPGADTGTVAKGNAPMAAGASGRCLDYRDTVTVNGSLVRETYPGPPNYESVAKGDEAETGFYLRLARPVCARNGTDETEISLDSVAHIQLVLDSAQYAGLSSSLGQEVSLRGTIFSSHTGHHHAPLLLVPDP